MKSIYIIIIVFYFFNNITLRAQSLNDGMYSKEWVEERDLYCKNSYIGKLANSAKKSLMSMGNSDVTTIVKPDGKGGVVNAGFRKPGKMVITNSSGGIMIVKGSSTQTAARNNNVNKINSNKLNSSKKQPSSFFLWKTEQRARAAQESYERKIKEKLRKKREDDRSEMIAKQNYYKRTEQEFRAAVERDHWHATEGARAVDKSLRPSDI